MTFFPDLSLARRLESHEAWSSSAHALTQAELFPQTGAAILPVAGGFAVFCGWKSPLNQVYGWGLSEPVQLADLDSIDGFYRSRDQDIRVRACPLADPLLFHVLSDRGFTIQDFMNVYVRQIGPPDKKLSPVPGIKITTASPEEARIWFELDEAGGDWAAPDGISFMIIRTTLKAGTRLFLAWHEGQPVGGGGLEIHDGVAALMAAGTLPAFRNRGVHTALLRARLSAAAEAGCDLAMVHTSPGAASQRNVLRSGFQLAYTAVSLIKPIQHG